MWSRSRPMWSRSRRNITRKTSLRRGRRTRSKNKNKKEQLQWNPLTMQQQSLMQMQMVLLLWTACLLFLLHLCSATEYDHKVKQSKAKLPCLFPSVPVLPVVERRRKGWDFFFVWILLSSMQQHWHLLTAKTLHVWRCLMKSVFLSFFLSCLLVCKKSDLWSSLCKIWCFFFWCSMQ